MPGRYGSFDGTPEPSIPFSARSEVPRVVYLGVCQSIGESLAAEGYRYAKSGPKCSRRVGDLTYEVSFGSSNRNEAGDYIKLSVGVLVASRKMKQWEKSVGFPQPAGLLGSRGIGALTPEYRYMFWNVADPRSRQSTTEGIVAAIEELAFPWFASFEDVSARCSHLVKHAAVDDDYDVVHAIEYLSCFASRDDAITAARNWLQSNPPDSIQEYLGQYQIHPDGAPPDIMHASRARMLAVYSRFLGFGDLSTDVGNGN